MAKFFPHYLNADLKLPSYADYNFGLLFDLIHYEVKWSNITYSEAKLDIKDVRLDFSRKYDKSLIKVDFPAIEDWTISANQEVNTWLFPESSPIELVFKDLDIDGSFALKLDEKGYLDPVVNDMTIKFGDSFLYHDNWFVAFCMHQTIEFAIQVIQNSVYFVGGFIFSHMFGPILDSFLNHYVMKF